MKFIALLLFPSLTLNIYSDSYTDRINIFLEAKKFDYMQINNLSEDIVSGTLVLGNQDIILKIESPYRESYIINNNFVTYIDHDFSQQQTFEYDYDDFPLIRLIASKNIIESPDIRVITLKEDGVLITDKNNQQSFFLHLKDDQTLEIQFNDNYGISNSVNLIKIL